MLSVFSFRNSLCALLLGVLTTSCAGAPVQELSQPGGELSDGDKAAKIMCLWNAYGQRQYVCLDPPMKEAQEKCDETATKERGEKATCSCTQDKNYIKDMCADDTEPPVNSGMRRRN